MWFYRSRAGRWPAPRNPWGPAASARLPPARAAPGRASLAGFRARGVRSRPAHSTPAEWVAAVWRAIQALNAAPAWLDAAVEWPPEARPDRAGPMAATDSRGVPGRFCRWIRRYWGCVGNVFSCRLQTHTNMGIPYLPRVLQIVCTPSHTILYREGHTIGAGILRKWGRKAF